MKQKLDFESFNFLFFKGNNMATRLLNKPRGEWITLIPSPEVLLSRRNEVAEELRQLDILLKTSIKLERSKLDSRSSKPKDGTTNG